MAEIPPSNNDAPFYSRDQVHWISANRAAIEQGKGILMFVFGLDANHALQMIKSYARATRVSLRLLAEQFVDDVSALTHDERLDLESACIDLLLTAHRRVRRLPEGK